MIVVPWGAETTAGSRWCRRQNRFAGSWSNLSLPGIHGDDGTRARRGLEVKLIHQTAGQEASCLWGIHPIVQGDQNGHLQSGFF
jgi:hypothetical protein